MAEQEVRLFTFNSTNRRRLDLITSDESGQQHLTPLSEATSAAVFQNHGTYVATSTPILEDISEDLEPDTSYYLVGKLNLNDVSQEPEFGVDLSGVPTEQRLLTLRLQVRQRLQTNITSLIID